MKAFMLSCGKNCTLSLERVVKKKRNAVYLDLTITLPSSSLLRLSETHQQFNAIYCNSVAHALLLAVEASSISLQNIASGCLNVRGIV